LINHRPLRIIRHQISREYKQMPNSPRLPVTIFLIIIALLVGGCSSTKISNKWRAENIDEPRAKKILLLSLIKDPVTRAYFEDHFVAVAKKKGIDIIPSHLLAPNPTDHDEEELLLHQEREDALGRQRPDQEPAQHRGHHRTRRRGDQFAQGERPDLSIWQHIAERIGRETGSPFEPHPPSSLGGGCINTAVRLSDGRQQWFVKLNGADRLDMFEAEALGLEEMANTGTIRVPRPLCTGSHAGQSYMAARNGFGGKIQKLGEELLEKFPALMEHAPVPSLIHGDLWGGNLAYDDRDRPVIYDPATYYGDREAEIAMTELFGGFGKAFYDAYNAAWPLDPGYGVRKTLYNLYHILNHANMFGGGYIGQAQSMMERLLAEL